LYNLCIGDGAAGLHAVIQVTEPKAHIMSQGRRPAIGRKIPHAGNVLKPQIPRYCLEIVVSVLDFFHSRS
jgi:hypothetical protein